MEKITPNENSQMTNYDIFAKFYDAVMGDREKTAARILDLIKEHNPDARTILELAAGTGTNLAHLSKDYKVSGLDLSEGMLEVAKSKLPDANFYHQDMISFELPERFDIILCLFDSINHILNFDQWQEMFKNVQIHLNKKGVFIFDVNTPEKLQRTIHDKPFIKEFDGNKMEMTVQDEGHGIVNWNVKFQENSSAVIQEENIKEIAFPTQQIIEALKTVFSTVNIKEEPNSQTGVVERVYFSCSK